jgi:hypothetical protein
MNTEVRHVRPSKGTDLKHANTLCAIVSNSATNKNMTTYLMLSATNFKF